MSTTDPAKGASNDTQRLKVIGVLNQRSTTLGIPSKYFAAACGLSFLFMWQAPLVVGIPLAVMILLPLYLVHVDDPHGLDTLIDSMGRPLCYEAASVEALELVLVRETRHAFLFDDPRLPDEKEASL